MYFLTWEKRIRLIDIKIKSLLAAQSHSLLLTHRLNLFPLFKAAPAEVNTRWKFYCLPGLIGRFVLEPHIVMRLALHNKHVWCRFSMTCCTFESPWLHSMYYIGSLTASTTMLLCSSFSQRASLPSDMCLFSVNQLHVKTWSVLCDVTMHLLDWHVISN